ncbi:Cft2 family RNA processing exonuclease [Ereboglobus sp. PH5-5]|uniref:MBL fold metallo-hydrolase n=1 Tax=Ereboglobus sp. PH5-5 TaxID=2940529 RepID=UPI00240640AD|nr:MBL fold metallo-hydrolase [Ereboglobus sp. PH5-5]MDF9833171.1 Cft2 family RNA processing exonuclease [Ereboglobus sp. PH5-5]
MKLIDLNRDGAIGANCTYLQIGELKVIIDSGLHPKKAGREATPDFSKIRGVHLDLIIITHCHLDHIGSLPVLMREHPEAPVVMTTSSAMLLERMLHNSANVMLRQKEEANIPEYPLFTHEEIDRLKKRFTGIPFGQAKRVQSGGNKDAITFILHPAGHVAGAAGVEIQHKRRKIFITGDVLFDNQRTLNGAKFPVDRFDTLIMETTRGNTERPPEKSRANEVVRLVDTINETIQRGGSCLIPVFALGRQQEVLSIIHDARKFRRLVDCPIYASGLGMDLADYLDEISRKTKHANFNRGIIKELKIKPAPRKLNPGEDPKQNALYIISSGMLVERTPSYVLASGLIGNANNTICFVGYCDPSTPGGEILASRNGDTYLFKAANVKAKIKARVEKFELSGHADREELLQYAVQCNPRSIVLTHGEPASRAWFMEQLTEALPKAKITDPVPLQEYQI